MSYNAKVFNVMIASPDDVVSERKIIREVIYEWNDVNSQTRNIVLLPIGWETHASPEMGEGPQKIINKQVLEKCDVLVGVFWTRLGTITEDYASGTVEEIEKHIQKGKLTMLYFSSQPVALDTVDTKQIEQIKEFKKYCQSRGLYCSYDSLADFKDIFYRHLQLKLNEDPLFSDIDSITINEFIESKINMPTLSKDAEILLKQASLDSNGTVLYLRTLSGSEIQTNGQNIIKSDSQREIAKWEAVIEELLKKGLLIEKGNKGEVFTITNEGYEIADLIKL